MISNPTGRPKMANHCTGVGNNTRSTAFLIKCHLLVKHWNNSLTHLIRLLQSFWQWVSCLGKRLNFCYPLNCLNIYHGYLVFLFWLNLMIHSIQFSNFFCKILEPCGGCRYETKKFLSKPNFSWTKIPVCCSRGP